jgi:excalibur calcium-binding domain-containing protein
MQMRSFAPLVVSAVALTGVLAAAPADAAPPKRFANCTALTKVYPHGVAKSTAAANRQVRDGNGRPAVKSAVYAVNAGSDRDKDGTACEG